MMERIFNDPNEPFWRSAKRTELGLIDPRRFAPFIRERFDATGRGIDDEVVELTLIVCLANFTNRFNNGLAVPLE